MKSLIQGKMMEYIDRAEKLKTHIQSIDEKRGKEAVSANGKSAGSGGSSKWVDLPAFHMLSMSQRVKAGAYLLLLLHL